GPEFNTCELYLSVCRAVWPSISPYTTLFRSRLSQAPLERPCLRRTGSKLGDRLGRSRALQGGNKGEKGLAEPVAYWRFGGVRGGDRKSTRLNSSHVANSYAVF